MFAPFFFSNNYVNADGTNATRAQATNRNMGDYSDYVTQYGLCPSWALSLGYGGVAAGAVLSNWGSAVRMNNL